MRSVVLGGEKLTRRARYLPRVCGAAQDAPISIKPPLPPCLHYSTKFMHKSQYAIEHNQAYMPTTYTVQFAA